MNKVAIVIALLLAGCSSSPPVAPSSAPSAEPGSAGTSRPSPVVDERLFGELTSRLNERGLPTVLVDAAIDGPGFPSVSCDDAVAVEQPSRPGCAGRTSDRSRADRAQRDRDHPAEPGDERHALEEPGHGREEQLSRRPAPRRAEEHEDHDPDRE
jgi:hypothetical protein